MHPTIFGGAGRTHVISAGIPRTPAARLFAAIERLEERCLLAAQLTAALSAPNIAAATSGSESVTVVFTATSDINASGLPKTALQVSGPVGVSVTSDSVSKNETKKVTAVFAVAAPVGGWTGTDNGVYTLTLSAGAAKDSAGQSSLAASGSFQVNVPIPPISAVLSAANIVAPTSGGELVTVVFTADSNINASALQASALQVSGPIAVPVTSVTVSKNQTKSVTAVFTIAAPAGGWSGADNGTYTLTLSAGAVTGAAGQSSPAAAGSFTVNVPLLPPTAVLSAPNIVAPTNGGELVTVVFTAKSNINASGLKATALQVSGPVDLSVTGVSVSNNQTKSVTAVFTVAAPIGGWTGLDNGLYTLSLAAGAVKDATGQGAVAAIGSFQVNVPVPPPSAVLSAANIVALTSDSELVTAVFGSERNINASGLQDSALQVSGPNSLSVTGVSVSQDDSTSVTAVFAVAAPTGGWTGADNGLYTITLSAAAVMDSAGQGSVAATASFTVNIPLPPGSIDPTFGKNLPVTVGFAAEAIATQPGGQLLIAGHVGDLTAGTSQGVIEALNADGSVNTSFGNDGQVLTAAGNNDAFHCLLLQSNGDIVAVGSTQDISGNTEFLLSRYDSSGQIDTSFGESGRVVTNFGGSVAVAYAAAITSSGQIIAAGSSDDKFAFAAYDSTGTLDASFGQAGRQLFALSSGSSSDMIGSLAVAPDGDIVASGISGSHVVIIQLDPSGNADTSFGEDGNSSGIVIVPGLSAPAQAGTDDAGALTVDSSGRILVGGETAAGDLGLVRFDPFGTLDTTFGVAGIASANFSGDVNADLLLPGDSGQVYAIGTSGAAVSVAEFDSTGTLVPTFGNAGQVEITPDSGTLTSATAAMQNGQLVVAGSFAAADAGGSGSALLHRVVTSADPASVGSGAPPPPVATQPLGLISRKQHRATFTLPDKTRVTVRLTGGSGTAWEIDGRISLAISSTSRAAALSIFTTGSSHSATLDNVTVTGSLGRVGAPAASVAGTLYASGSIGTLRLAQVTGMIVSGGSISSLNAASFSNATVLSGVSLGDDDQLGGIGPNADTFSTGKIGSIHVAGTVSNSLIAAGIDPIDGNFLDPGDQALGGAASRIGSIVLRGPVDSATRFVAGAFGHARIPKPADTATDPHFLTRTA